MKFLEDIKDCVSFSDILRYHARHRSDNVAIYDKTRDVQYTFKEWDHSVDLCVCYLRERGCARGDIISVVLSNCFEYFLLYCAALRIGSIINPFPHNLGARDIHKYLSYVKPKLVFCEDKHFQELLEKKWPVHIIYRREEEHFLDALKQQKITDFQDYTPEQGDVACLYYSSGTTANPKGILYSHGNMIALISSVVRGFHFKPTDCHLIGLPLGHTAAINYSFLPCLYCGASIVLCESFWKIRSTLWDYVEKYNVTYLEVVPSVLFALVNTPYKKYNRAQLKHLSFIGCGSAPLPMEIQKKTQDKFSVPVGNLYGLSETGPTHIDDPRIEGWQPGSIGIPLDVNDAMILDETGCEAKIGTVGEIAIKGDNIFVGYYKNEEAYKKVFNRGYFMTGDLGFQDTNGVFYFAERRKDLIIKGGVNIFPGEIDEVLFSHPQVKEAITVGMADAYLGQQVKSFIVPQDGQDIDKEELKEFCAEQLGDFKCPDEFVFVADIPKGPSGKLLRRVLQEKG